MDADLWGWFDRFYWEAWRAGDLERLKLVELYHHAWDYMETDPKRAVGYLEQGRAAAQRLAEYCWVLFFDYWLAETHLFYLDDLKEGMDRAVRTAVEARKPAYESCPVRGRVYRILVDAYMARDPIGYLDKIRETSAYMEQHLPLDDDTRYLLQARRARLAQILDDPETANAEALRFLAISEHSDFQQTYAYSLLAEFAYQRGDLSLALKYAQDGEQCALRSDRRASLAALLAWQALLLYRLGDTATAASRQRQAEARCATLGIIPYETYYDAICEYYEQSGKPDTALALRGQQLKEAQQAGSAFSICECLLERCKLFKRTGQTEALARELAAARAAAAQLLAPDYYLKKLDAL